MLSLHLPKLCRSGIFINASLKPNAAIVNNARAPPARPKPAERPQIRVVDNPRNLCYDGIAPQKGEYIAEWSSSVARRAHNPKVVGSNPASATKNDTAD
jgi:hypothetical protein